ncbi:hypothetical protein NQ314_006206 [Rhamnusium bicolor]|uniref:G-protein coupled receptors family 1 profile domain-containing protein n=1 Tax=Rhamnusium bicolor TaxID=1586634 RepID=A0AAV8Z6E1_9CUCU|nr:hypothetical protein NQ314_006206 [Rhamnusium bicolor]
MSTPNLKQDNFPVVVNSSLHVVPENTRNLFYWIILTITIATLIGNFLAIRSIIINVSMSLINIGNSSLGEFLCYFIPMGQVLGTTASSVALLVIALDRYQNVIYALTKRWDPTPWICILIAAVLWIMCVGWGHSFMPPDRVFGHSEKVIRKQEKILSPEGYYDIFSHDATITQNGKDWSIKDFKSVSKSVLKILSYPMYTYFQYEPIKILFVGPHSVSPVYSNAHMCLAIVKQRLTIYYVTMAFLIFLPTVIIFFWFYYKIAVLIWKHRKPLSLRFNKFQKETETEDSSTTKTTDLSGNANKNAKANVKGKNVQVERKIRTFKIVIVLMISFIFCRLPYWCFFVVKVVGTYKGETMWNISFALIALNMLNCTLNPLLYTFLNQTIRAFKTANDFICKICCCCFSNAEFEEFEKDNPFVRENYDPRKSQIVKDHPKSNRNSRVKFVDVAHLAMYSQECNANSPPKY